MFSRGSIGSFTLLAALCMSIAGAAAEDSKYPELRGQWVRAFVPRWTVGQEKPPLTPEYQKVFEANLADMANGGPGNVPSWYCLPQGMPMMMNAHDPINSWCPETTYVLIQRRPLSSNLHRWTRLAQRDRADLCGVFNRQMDRRGWRRPLRRARSRDPIHSGAACL